MTPIAAPAREGLRAGVYGRASSDPKKRGRSIKDQFADADMECVDHRWTIHDHYEDRDRSATRRARKKREDWERLLGDAEDRVIDVIVYAERSRASRDMEVSIKLRGLCRRTGVLLCYDGRVYDMNDPNDFRDFTRDAVASEEEGESMIKRAGRTARLNAARGAPHGKIPFGFMRKYDPDDGHLIGQFPHPVHAPVILDVFERADRGEPFDSLVAELALYVEKASRFGLRYILKNRAYIGQRLHKGEYVKATWDGFVPEGLFWRVQALVNDPSRRTQKDSRAKHLLSGIANCSRCLAAYVRQPGLIRRRPVGNPNGKQRYGCPDGHMGTTIAALDAYVEEALLAWFGHPEALHAFRPAPADDSEAEKCRLVAATLNAQLDEARGLASVLGDDNLPRLSVLSLAQMERTLLPQIDKAQQRLAALLAVDDPTIDALLGALTAVEREEVWARMSVAKRRHVVRRSVNVTLNPARGRGVRTLERGRVTLTFLGEEGFVPRPRYGRTGAAA